MSTKTQVTTQAKTPASAGPAHAGQPPVAVFEREAERPDIATQLEGATRLGHSLGAVSVDRPAPPVIQRQELPEEEEEELQLKPEPAALQRQELPEEEEEEELQTKPANGVQRQGGNEGFQLDDETAGRINRARDGGQPLAEETKKRMSAALGYDFSGVRVHTDAEADQLNQRLQAKAFTTGPDIFFRRGEYNPVSGDGRELIAHELTHVVQQTTRRVRGDQRGMIVRPSGDAFEQEAEHAAGTRRESHEKSNTGEETRAASKPGWLTPADVEALQNTIGHRAVMRLITRGEKEGASRAQEPAASVALRAGQTLLHTSGSRADRRPINTKTVIQRRGSYDPLSIRQGNPAAIEEEEYGVGSALKFTYISSCIGIIGLTADRQAVKAVHLGLQDSAENTVTDHIAPLEAWLKEFFHDCHTVVTIGSNWGSMATGNITNKALKKVYTQIQIAVDSAHLRQYGDGEYQATAISGELWFQYNGYWFRVDGGELRSSKRAPSIAMYG